MYMFRLYARALRVAMIGLEHAVQDRSIYLYCMLQAGQSYPSTLQSRPLQIYVGLRWSNKTRIPYFLE